MANITTYPFASQIKEFGADLVWSPMVFSEAVIHNPEETLKIVDLSGLEPYFVQLLGYDPESMAKAAKIIESRLRPTAIDINFACPDKNVLKSGSGGAIIKSPELAAEIIKTVKKSVNIPVGVKTRIGFLDDQNFAEWIKNIENAGADFITIHGRTVKSGFVGKSDWEYIKKAKQLLKIPVIGSGDIKDYKEVSEKFKKYNPDGILIGRSSLAKPWIFEEVKKNQEILKSRQEIESLVIDLAQKFNKIWGQKGIREARKFFGWYIKGFEGAAEIRHKLVNASTLEEVKKILKK